MARGPAVNGPGWTPVRVHAARGTLEWRYTGDLTFEEPFFEDTVLRAMRRPYTALFPRETPLDAPGPPSPVGEGLPLAGLVLHMSRCGSTLVSRLLRAIPECSVLSEAPPVDGVIRARFRLPGLSRTRHVAWLRAVVAALGRTRRPGERRLVLKLDAWSTPALPLLREAFPGVPWVFVYREPLEVLVSQMRRRGLHAIPGAIEPELFGFEPDEPSRTSPEVHVARVLAAICRAALEAEGAGGIFVSYDELPLAVESRVAPHFGMDPDAAARAEMARLAGMDAKSPMMPFTPDRDEKRRAVSPELHKAAAEWLEPLYLRLEARRTGTSRC